MILNDIEAVADPGGWVLDKIKTALKTALSSAPYAAKFAATGGVLMTDNSREMNEWLAKRAGRPFLFLECSNIQIDEDTNASRTRWLIEISIEVVTLSATSIYETALKSAVVAILNNARRDLRALGIEESTIRAGQGSGAQIERINPHTFSCALHTARD